MRVFSLGSVVVSVVFCVGCGGASPPAESPSDSANSESSSDGADDTAPADSMATSAGEAPDTEAAEESAGGADDESARATGDEDADPPDAIKREPGEETRTLKVVQQIIRQNRQLVRDCYEKALKKNKGLQGDLTLHFVIGPKGDVKSAELNRERSTLTDPEVVQCAVAAMKTLTFPKSSRGFESKVNYPFNLNP